MGASGVSPDRRAFTSALTRACDDLVLACDGARASEYANHLLEIVTAVRLQGAPATALPMADKREFEGRMLAILDPAVQRWHCPCHDSVFDTNGKFLDGPDSVGNLATETLKVEDNAVVLDVAPLKG